MLLVLDKVFLSGGGLMGGVTFLLLGVDSASGAEGGGDDDPLELDEGEIGEEFDLKERFLGLGGSEGFEGSDDLQKSLKIKFRNN